MFWEQHVLFNIQSFELITCVATVYSTMTLGSHSFHLHNWYLDMCFHQLYPHTRGKNLLNPLKSSVLQFMNLLLKLNFYVWCRNQRFWIFAVFKDFFKDSLSFSLENVFSGNHKLFPISLCIIYNFNSKVGQYIWMHTYVSTRHT